MWACYTTSCTRSQKIIQLLALTLLAHRLLSQLLLDAFVPVYLYTTCNLCGTTLL
jgi:hypothetical protein